MSSHLQVSDSNSNFDAVLMNSLVKSDGPTQKQTQTKGKGKEKEIEPSWKTLDETSDESQHSQEEDREDQIADDKEKEVEDDSDSDKVAEWFRNMEGTSYFPIETDVEEVPTSSSQPPKSKPKSSRSSQVLKPRRSQRVAQRETLQSSKSVPEPVSGGTASSVVVQNPEPGGEYKDNLFIQSF